MPTKKLSAVFFNPRVLIMFIMGFSSGLPLALTGGTLQAWFAESGVSVLTIGALTLVGLPYVWKFVWAPFMDRFAPLGDRRRGWILLTQGALIFTLFLLAQCNPTVSPMIMGLLALAIAFFSASQDVSIDAYRTDILLPEERGVGSATYIFAYRMAMLVSGGLGLVLAQYYGWRFTYQLMSGLLLLSAVATYFAPKTSREKDAPHDIILTIKQSFSNLLQRDSIVLVLLFTIFYKFGDALVATLSTTFLLHGLGFTLANVGVIYKTCGLVATILGAFTGGALMVRLGLYRSLLYFGFAQAFSTLMFVILAVVGKNMLLMASTIFIESFCSGMGTAAFVAFLMSLCDHRYTATQYACLSALAAIGRVFLGPFAGFVVEAQGWTMLYAWSFLLSFPGLILLWLIRYRVSFNAETYEY